MINLAHLSTYITQQTSYACKESPEILPEELDLQLSDTVVFVDYNGFMSTSAETSIAFDCASELDSEIVFLVSVELIATNNMYPNCLTTLYKALQNYKPLSDLENIRSFTFLNGDFVRTNGRRITKMVWAFTFDRVIY
jgi:hypothetical protein